MGWRGGEPWRTQGEVKRWAEWTLGTRSWSIAYGVGVGTATEYTLYDTITIFGPQYDIIVILNILRYISSIVIWFCHTLRYIFPIYYISYAGSLTLTSFPISAVTQEKNEVLRHIQKQYYQSRCMYQNRPQYSVYKYCNTWTPRSINKILCWKILQYSTVLIFLFSHL